MNKLATEQSGKTNDLEARVRVCKAKTRHKTETKKTKEMKAWGYLLLLEREMFQLWVVELFVKLRALSLSVSHKVNCFL